MCGVPFANALFHNDQSCVPSSSIGPSPYHTHFISSSSPPPSSSYFKMALACQMADRPSDALLHCERAVRACLDRTAWLTRVLAGLEGGEREGEGVREEGGASAGRALSDGSEGGSKGVGERGDEPDEVIGAQSSVAAVKQEIEDIGGLTRELQEKVGPGVAWRGMAWHDIVWRRVALHCVVGRRGARLRSR